MLVVVSCNKNANQPVPIVKVGEQVLYKYQLEKVIPADYSSQDSTLLANDYINKWIKKELLLLKAETNLTEEQKDINEELREYRISLLGYRYKNELMKQKMDTVVAAEEIESYYQKHRDKFVLNHAILKAIYIKIPMEVVDPLMLKNLCQDEDPQKISELDEHCISYAKAYDKFNNEWIDADVVLNNIPAEFNDLGRFLRRNKYIESKDSDYYYLVCIRDFRLSGQAAPVEYVESQVKNLILNARKIQFLKKIEEDIYKEGIENNRVRIYKTKK